jgi:hypothetical protein
MLPIDSTLALHSALENRLPGAPLRLRLSPGAYILEQAIAIAGFNLSIAGVDATLSGAGASQLFNVSAGGSLTLWNVTLTGGNTTLNGGGVLAAGTGTRVQLSSVNVTNCSASYGGGLAIESGATLSMWSCSLSLCRARYPHLDAVWRLYGGGLYVGVASEATLVGCEFMSCSAASSAPPSVCTASQHSNRDTSRCKNQTAAPMVWQPDAHPVSLSAVVQRGRCDRSSKRRHQPQPRWEPHLLLPRLGILRIRQRRLHVWSVFAQHSESLCNR